MKKHLSVPKIEERQSNAHGLSLKSNDQQATFQFADHRSETHTQRQIQATINQSPQVLQQKANQEFVNQAITPIQQKTNHTGLPDQLKSGIEHLSGVSMDDVKVHYNSNKPAQLQAHAYAQGNNIHVGSGQEKHLPHEAWHVVQQKQGRVKPTLQMKGTVNINDDSGLEKEADTMGDKAMQAPMANTVVAPYKINNQTSVPPVAQRYLSTEIEGPNAERALNLVLAAAHKDKILREFIMLARKNARFNIQFQMRSSAELEGIEKGLGGAAAATGLFSSGAVIVNEERHFRDLGKIRSVNEIEKLRNELFSIRIIINSDTIDEKTVGQAVQIIAHELTIHAIKFYPLLKLLLAPEREVSNEEIFKRIHLGYQIPRTMSELEEGQGIFTPAVHHREMLHHDLGPDGHYGRLKKILVESMKPDELDSFQEREGFDVQSVFGKNKIFERELVATPSGSKTNSTSRSLY